MMRYAGSILGAGVLAGVLRDSTAGHADINTFRFVMMAVAGTAALATAAATFIHRLPAAVSTPVPGDLGGHAPTGALAEMRRIAGN
jgi:hypothetical protein